MGVAWAVSWQPVGLLAGRLRPPFNHAKTAAR